MAISLEDRVAIHELLALHGHLIDGGELDRLSEVFTDDVVYDLSPLNGSVLRGTSAIRAAAERLGDRNPVAHLVTNIMVSSEGGEVTARSKFLGIGRDGTVGSGTYEDVLRLTAGGWRISSRSVSLRREPLTP